MFLAIGSVCMACLLLAKKHVHGECQGSLQLMCHIDLPYWSLNGHRSFSLLWRGTASLSQNCVEVEKLSGYIHIPFQVMATAKLLRRKLLLIDVYVPASHMLYHWLLLHICHGIFIAYLCMVSTIWNYDISWRRISHSNISFISMESWVYMTDLDDYAWLQLNGY